ncbi:globin domain-containing protein [Streptomyces sp. NPDC005969]|uniref:globin domain-containing protein n=1 Tax=Streptomyces sp. NPDC005969 TaxID=3156722 RepID=UPI0033CE8410
MSINTALIEWSFSVVERRADQLSKYFYAHLFHHNPGVRHMFPEQMDEQQDRLFAALTTAAMNTADPEALVAYLRPLGFDHRKFDTRPEHYPAVGASLIAALKVFAGDAWTQEVEEAWVAAYDLISQVMIAAAEEVPASTPRWWDAEVVHHELRTDDIAVLTVRPHFPYPFEAGQHAALTVPEAPQVWRPYSIANAPRMDGTLEFHVRRIERGRLSTSLVDRVRSGGSVRLGPATGSMTLPPDSGHGLLCVAGGTGWAPVKAIIEAAAALPRPGEVRLILGARTEREVYDLDGLERLAKTYDWLDVTAALPPEGGEPEDADAELLRQVGEYARNRPGRQACISGPSGMVRAVEKQLGALGFDPDRIHRDAYIHRYGTDDPTSPTSPAEWFLSRRDIPWIHSR